MTSTQAPDAISLEALADRYEIIGELGGRRDSRSYLARRKDTGADVLVSVFGRPEGDEGNALSHLASDANRLSESSHPNLVPVHEARWLANDTLALVTDRVRHPTLEEMLIRRNEEFSCPRVAMLLRDINGALEWARETKIVHRHLDPSSIFVVPGNDGVMLKFVLRPLPLADMPGAEDDARTIATLARAMLTRSVADPERDQLPLGELRPGLPDRLIQQTDQLLHPDPHERTPDVSEYIATVAMAEALKRGETECAETTRKLLEEERIAREKIEAERAATERAAAEQARLFQLEREAFAKEREEILAELQKQREVLERERALLARERAEHQQDRELLDREREEHRQWANEVERAFAAQTAALEQQTRVARERVKAERGEIQRMVEERVALELAARLPKDPESAAGDNSLARLVTKPKKVKRDDNEIAVPLALPPRPKHHRVTPQWVRKLSHLWSDARARLPQWSRPAWNRKWNVPAAAAAVLLLVVLSAVAIARGRGDADDLARPPVASAERVTDSAAGRVEPRSTAPRVDPYGLPADFVMSVRRSREAGVPADFVAGVRARSESVEVIPEDDGMVVYTPPSRETRPRDVPSRAQPGQRTISTPASPQSAVPVDTLFGLPSPYIPPISPVPPARDTARRDTLVRPRPDTLVVRDTLPASQRSSGRL